MPYAIERLESRPVTRIFLPESKPINRLYFPPHEEPPSLHFPFLRGGARGQRREDPAHHLPGRGDRIRSGEGARLLLRTDHRAHLRPAPHLRLPRTACQARPHPPPTPAP